MRLTLALLMSLAAGCGNQHVWPKGKSPIEIGNRAAEYALANHAGSIEYAKICSAYGLLRFAHASGNEELSKQVEAKYSEYLTGEKKDIRNDWQGAGVVAQWFGFVPFELYRQTGNKDYLALGKVYADEQFANRRDDGLPAYTRFWIDDMFGFGLLQGQACKYLKSNKYADQGIHALLSHAKKLQQPNGLFHHGVDKGHFFWGRGNGWAAAGMAQMLSMIPKNHSRRHELLDIYRRQMETLVKYQDKSGPWHQLIDYPDSWLETSGTGMFVFALTTGVNEGWLPEKPYLESARRGWLALANLVDEKGRLREVCVGTSRRKTPEGYLIRPRKAGDPHGQGPLLWAAAAMIEMDKN